VQPGVSVGVIIVSFAVVIASLCGCSPDSSTTEPGAIPEAHPQEIEGTHDPQDLDPLTAERWIDNVHIGHSVDPSGEIAQNERADAFATDAPAYLSMEVTDATAGTQVLVSVVDAETESELWSDTKTIRFGDSHLVFQIDTSALGSGEYRADVWVGDERVARRQFDVT